MDPADGDDMRVGSIRSTTDDVFLLAPRGFVDADPADDDATSVADIGGINITLTALAGGVGTTANFIETDLIDSVATGSRAGIKTGSLTVLSELSVYIEEIAGDLRVNSVLANRGNVSLAARSGLILDQRSDVDANNEDLPNVTALHIDLAAFIGSVGKDDNDLDIDSGVVNGVYVREGRVYVQGNAGIYLTESDRELNLLAARSSAGSIRLTVPDTSLTPVFTDGDPSQVVTTAEDLYLLADDNGDGAQIAQGAALTVDAGEVLASLNVVLFVGDNVVTNFVNRIAAGSSIRIRGDERRKADGSFDPTDPDVDFGSTMLLRGTIGKTGAPADASQVNVNDKAFTQIFGNNDVDTFLFFETDLDANTSAYGSAEPTVTGTLPTDASDGEDRFVVTRLGSMHVNAAGIGDTLTLDGQAGTDSYLVQTTGSQGAVRNYVINVLDTGAPDDGVDVLSVFGIDGSEADGATDDIFLLRRITAIPSEAATAPAFVALLHGNLDQTRTASANGSVRPQEVQRINYDANLNGRLQVYGAGGNDYFAVDDNSAITSLDGGSGKDVFQIGQIYGSQRKSDNLPATDQFDTIATTRGYVSRGVSMPLVAQGGSGDDSFIVYSNKAELRLEGDAGDDLFIVRAFALAKTDEFTGEILKDANGVAIPLTTADISTQGQMNVKPGEGNDTVQYNINAPVSVDGGTGFDKVVILGTEFPDNFVITENGVFGAGVNVRFQNIEVLEVDGLESDDDFYVLGTPVGVITRVIGGLGSDSVNVGGDVAEPIVMQQLEGSSSTIGHTVTAPGIVYDGLAIDGIDPTVAQAIAGAVVIRETDGSTVVEEGATSDPLSVDSYFVRLATRPADGVTVYVTVSAARSNREEQLADGDSMWLSKTAASAFTRPVTIDGQVVDMPDRALVLKFTSADWDQEQAVYVYGAQDSLPEGERTVIVNHSVLAIIEDASLNSPANDQSASVATFNFAKVRNVEVNILDDDAPTLILTQTGGSTLVLEGSLTPDGDGFAPGIADSVNLRLGKVLTAGQTVTVTLSYDTQQIALSGAGVTVLSGGQARITFDAASSVSGINIDVTAADDGMREDFKRSFVNAAVTATSGADIYNGQLAQLAVSVYDNDAPGVLVLQSNGSTQVVKDDPSTAGDQSVDDTYTVRLTQAPAADVTIAINTDGQVITVPTSLVFTSSNWYHPQTVTVKPNAAFNPSALPIDPTTQKVWAPRQHLLTKLGGPLSVVGGTLGERALTPAVLLPAEKNEALLQIGAQPDERNQIDTLNIYDDSSQEDKVGTLSATGLSGYGMAPDFAVGSNPFGEPVNFPGGITWGDADTGKSGIEVLNLLMGQGNDRLTITGTLLAEDEGRDTNRGPARHGTLTTVHGGGNLDLTPGGSDIVGDRINVTGGGGADSPLVIYGDTSQDGTWYSGITNLTSRTDNLVLGLKLFDQAATADDLFRFPRANPFQRAGNDVIDASALFTSADHNTTTAGITIYGGAGNDTIIGTQAADHLAGGSGDDTIIGGRGLDLIYGDSGFNVDPITRTLLVPTIDGGYRHSVFRCCSRPNDCG